MLRPIISLATSLTLGALSACGPQARSPDPPVEKRSAATQPKLKNVFRDIAAGPPGAIEDRLFILWEYGGALRERELAHRVLERSRDPEVRNLAKLVRDGHQAGMEAMRAPAADLGLRLPTEPTQSERADIDAAVRLPSDHLDRYFLRRQRAMHAWDVTVFDDYRMVTANPKLRVYVEATRAPLRRHAQLVTRLARARGVAGPDPAGGGR